MESPENSKPPDTTTLPPARLHTYLAGCPIPIPTSTRKHRRHASFRLPILHVPHVVVLPGGTLPLRLPRSWRGMLSQSQYEMGIITRDENQQRGSWLRQGMGPRQLRRFSAQLQAELIQDDDDNSIVVSDDEEESTMEKVESNPKIGTLVTVSLEHETEQADEIVVVAKATGRFVTVSSEDDEQGWVQARELLELNLPRCKNMAAVTPLPAQVYRQYWQPHLRSRLNVPIDDFVPSSQVVYAVADSMNLSLDERRRLLQTESSALQLRYLLHLQEQQKQPIEPPLACRRCAQPLAERSSLFTVPGAEHSAAYVNAFGSVHQVTTVLHAQGILLQGAPETRDSWFPGYSWTIVCCENCQCHLGWEFKRVKRCESSGRVQQFYGFTFGSVV